MRIISGKYGGRSIRTIPGEGMRPATGRLRSALFSMLEARGVAWNGLRVLDLFAGSGSLGFEALSRGAESVFFVENNPKVAAVIQKSGDDLEVEPGRLRISTDPVARVLGKRPGKTCGLVFVDPPYASNVVAGAVKLLLKNGWLEPGAIIAAEVEAKPQEGKPISAESLADELTVLADRAYGQTRLILWEFSGDESE